ncbi:tudor domain-containing protein 6 [Notolabrus celidotus]|uniref:tudor domain-containing protein 6 n=1 Tax=Notolabrus celidotus TaxID=1203425 RepID=UPI0014903348|nr:tudor domain-containing protein 6 [Notolabrus celidotus]XP_034530681.1 tudor domain-containing protein 6 [Notolabrus celidotus]
MCSIPGLPTPGSEVSVLVTRVNPNSSWGLVELWVNIGHERNPIYAQMREEIQIPKRKFNGCEGKPADLCLVCISDTWHRARIVSSQSETYNVFLIDQGQLHITTNEALAWGQSDCFLLPPEMKSCILANVLSLEDTWSEKASNILKSLHGKSLKGLVQHVLMPERFILLDIPTVSKHMSMLGIAKKVPADEFKCLVQERLYLQKGVAPEVHLNVSLQAGKNPQYYYPELLTETFETVNVTEVYSPHSIFCKIKILTKAVKNISEQIQQHYEAGLDFEDAQPRTCGDPCAAKGKNSRWNRSLLKENMKSNGSVEVLHVDEGKTELVPVDDIKPLHEEFLKMPVFTYPCSMDGVENNGTGWTTEQTDYLKSLLLNQTVMAKLNSHDILQDVYNVTLHAFNGECINSNFTAKTGILSPLKTEEDSKVPAVLSSLCSHGDEQSVDLSKDDVNIDALQEETLPRTKDLDVNGRAADLDTSDVIYIQESSEHADPVVPSNSRHHAGFHYVMQNADDPDDVYTVGRSINVKVSCIESLQKFWCQTADNSDLLKHLMQDLQNHYESNHPGPLVESICVARNPDNNMWSRARIIASHHSPVVDVRFIDYGHTRKVPLQDVRPIDPAFLRLHAQAFQCCLFNLKNPSNPTAISGTDAALEEFMKFMDWSALSNTGLKCIVKAVTSDEDGVPLNVVDIEASSESACKRLAEIFAQAETPVPIPPEMQSDAYNYSTHNIDVGAKEAVHVTSSNSVNHLYCQLNRNSSLLDKVMENVKQLIGQSKCTGHPLRLNSICFAKYTDNQWYRGQVVEMSPKLKVKLVDYGDTLALNESDVRPFPTEAGIARSAPVQAVPLGLYNVPAEVPQEVNQWFADEAIGCNFTISVVAKEANGKLIVELFVGSLNVNKKVREMIHMTQQKVAKGLIQKTNQQLYISSTHTDVPNGDCLVEELMTQTVIPKMAEGDQANKSNAMCCGDQLHECSQSVTYATQDDLEITLDSHLTLDVILEASESVLTETFIQDGDSDSKLIKHSPPSCPEGNLNICMYQKPNISPNKTEDVYASCIVGPNHFWCQYANTEDLNLVSRLAQEAGKTQQDTLFTKSLDRGNPCLALFSSDNQWYRAQVLQRTESSLLVLFIDYGNESDVDIKNVRPLPQTLLDAAPQAFFCSLNGFDESRGSWDDDAYDDFYTRLVDKQLRVTVFNVGNHSGITVPKFAVQIQSDNVLVNEAMQKYWKTAAKECVETDNIQLENSIQDSQTEFNHTHLSVSKGSVNNVTYKKPNISKNQTEEVYASCIPEPHFFWCQYADMEEELRKISQLVQKAAQAQQNDVLPQTLVPGSPCLALFPSDGQWYRAQVLHRVDDAFHVLFIDYGNESNTMNVRPVPQTLLDMAPRALLCSLDGFDVSKGSWDDDVSEDFFNLLVDKPLKLRVLNMKNNLKIHTPQYNVEIECEGVLVNAAMKKYWKTSSEESVSKKSPQTETSLQKSQTESNTTQITFSKENVNAVMYREPEVSRIKAEMVYASCIVEPSYFWCQYANTEELNKVSQLAQEAGLKQHDLEFADSLSPGSPCLALFSSDEQWYRAQVICKEADSFRVRFIDYGNESNADFKNVRPLPQTLLDAAPQAFLCSLDGFEVSRGSWDDNVYDDFHTLLVDKPLRVTVLSMNNQTELAVPQFKVQVDCDGVVVKELMEKYWKGLNTDHSSAEAFRPEQDEEDC